MTTTGTDRDQALEYLRTALSDPRAEFHADQWESIGALVNERKKLLVVQRTGWGKSSVYFIATRLLRDRGFGPTLIVSPLLALMRNQLEAAERLGIRPLTINSTNESEWPGLIEDVLSDKADALLVSPERLANDDFVEEVLNPIADRIGLMVVDEAHCISDWGHDFRPDYRRLVNILRMMPPNMAVLGTTATANNRVIDDIHSQLGDIEVKRGALMRQSLRLQTIRLPDSAARLAWLAEHLPELPGTGIIYTLTRRDADQVTAWLNRHGIDALAYYSNVAPVDVSMDRYSYREYLENRLQNNEIKALVATSALGMGYDKPDLGFVVHYQAPGSVISYYQQVGRAGRAIDEAYGILLSGAEDDEIQEYFRRKAFPEEAQVQRLLQELADSDGLSIWQLEKLINLRKSAIQHALKFLSVESPAPVMKQGSTWVRTPVNYQMDHDHIERLTRQREEEWLELQAYIDTTGCLMEYLARALDDESPVVCGRCSRCLGEALVPESYSTETAIEATLFLRHSEFDLKCKVQVARDAFQIYDFTEGSRVNLPREMRANTGKILSRWGDAGWGGLVADDKHAGLFRHELVDAVAAMIRERWQPEPFPEWVTCVPSLSNPDLAPDFARRLADRLGLPFIPALSKVRKNAPQKTRENRFYQCRNLDGAFSVSGGAPSGPVFLIDDVVDSGWTMTVCAALLRQAGSGEVFPVALATSVGLS